MWNSLFRIFCLAVLLGASPVSASEVLTPYTGGIGPYEPRMRKVALEEAGKVRAGIVSHHGLAAKMIARFYDLLPVDCDSVILIGPDHFKAGLRNVTVCPLSWRAGERVIGADGAAVSLLETTRGVGVESVPFRLEHSIGLHVEFLSRYCPNARVTALIVKNTAVPKELSRLVPILADLMNEKTILILSMDFSHEKMSDEARREDDESLKRIIDFRTSELQGLDIDAPRAAWLFLEVLKKKGVTKGRVLERTNSAEIAGRPVNEPCTSYATVVFSE